MGKLPVITMVSSVSFSLPGAQAGAAPDAGPSAALQDRLARCMKQLGDWEGCPSGKTPEGQKIIHNLRTQIDNLQARINQSQQPAASQPSTAQGSTPQPIPGGASSTLGGRLDVYA